MWTLRVSISRAAELGTAQPLAQLWHSITRGRRGIIADKIITTIEALAYTTRRVTGRKRAEAAVIAAAAVTTMRPLRWNRRMH